MEHNASTQDAHTRDSQHGWIVFVGLALLTVVEYIIAVGIQMNLVILMVIAVVKAALIARYFMHIQTLFREEEAH